MRRKHLLLAVGAAGALLLAAGTAGAAQAGPRFFDRIAVRLGLSDDQRAQIRDIASKHWSSGLGDAVKRARLARRDLRDAIRDPAADERSIRRAAREAAAAESDLAVARHATFVEAFAVLTPEQQAQAKALEESAERRRDRRRGASDGEATPD